MVSQCEFFKRFFLFVVEKIYFFVCGTKYKGTGTPYQRLRNRLHPKTLMEMRIIRLDPVSANFEKGRGSEWAVSVGQRLPSRFVQRNESGTNCRGSAGN